MSGSGKKPAAQKGRGAARVGNLRAPGRKKGGAAHGPVPRDRSFPMNNKLKLFGLKSLLSARLYDGKIIVIDSEELDYSKTKFLNEIIKPFG